jgi:hypothetical protein
MYLLCGFYIFGRKGGLLAMPRMSKKRKQEWALFLNDRNRITYNELCRKCSSEYGERGAAAAGAVLKPSGGNCAVSP